MVGDNVPKPLIESHALPTGEPLFSIRGVVARDPAGYERLGPLDLDIRPGEIVGVAGVGGNGQDELVECAAGILSPVAGAIRFAGADLTNASAARLRRAGIGYVSADRRHEGLCLAAALTENFIAGREHDRAFSRFGFLRGANIRSEAARAFERLGVRYGALGRPPAISQAATSSAWRSPANFRARRNSSWSRNPRVELHRGLCVYPEFDCRLS